MNKINQTFVCIDKEEKWESKIKKKQSENRH